MKTIKTVQNFDICVVHWFAGFYNYLHIEKPASPRKPLAELSSAPDYVSQNTFLNLVCKSFFLSEHVMKRSAAQYVDNGEHCKYLFYRLHKFLYWQNIIVFTFKSSYCFQCVLAIAILFVCLSVRHTGGSVKNGAS